MEDKLNKFMLSPELKVQKEELEGFVKFIEDKRLTTEIIDQKIYERYLGSKTVNLPPKPKREISGTKIEIIKEYTPSNRKRDIYDWVKYYNDRFSRLKDILINTRPELRNTTSIYSALQDEERKQISLVGMIKEKSETTKKHIILDLEDATGVMRTIVLNKKSCFKDTEQLVTDEVVGVVGTKSKDVVFVDKIIVPEVPERPFKKCEDDVYAAYISDIHIGSNMFLSKQFSKFIDWLNGNVGDAELKKISKKVKYLFILGDNVDGIGVYPKQEEELDIQDIFKQYDMLAEFLEKVPKDIQMIMIPGNHDALGIAEPQTQLPRELSERLYNIPNLVLVSNPAWINIHNVNGFPGYLHLLYHGQSVNYFINTIPSLRKAGYKNTDTTLRFLLKKRHLAPHHGSVRILPRKEDFLVVDPIPDIFACGDVHCSSTSRYRNILNIVASCWQGKTAYQERMGHDPEPGVVPVFSLKENKVMKLRFDK
jgi:DNA polymerase II small subunit